MIQTCTIEHRRWAPRAAVDCQRCRPPCMDSSGPAQHPGPSMSQDCFFAAIPGSLGLGHEQRKGRGREGGRKPGNDGRDSSHPDTSSLLQRLWALWKTEACGSPPVTLPNEPCSALTLLTVPGRGTQKAEWGPCGSFTYYNNQDTSSFFQA